MIQEIEKLEEIAELINDKTYALQLERMKTSLEKKEVLISVMGQFSAGKSRLINHLIGKDVLPVHITETTAVITLIKYAPEETVEIVYEDGSREQISIEESLELWQSGNTERIQRIETLVIYVNAAFLSHGLMIADTPGVNTVIEKHMALAAEIMERSDRILYVMGKPVTEVDLNFMNKIRNYGLSLLLVRTHIDEMNSSEEDIHSSILKETQSLQQYSDDRIFFVSNEESNIYFAQIKELEKYITKQLSEDISQYIEKLCREKMKYIAEQYEKILIDKKNSCRLIVNENKEEYLKKKEKIDKAIQNLNNILEESSQKLRNNYEEEKIEAYEYVAGRKEYYLKEIKNDFEAIKDPLNESTYIDVVKNNAEACYQDVKESYLMYFDRLLGESKNAICKELDSYELNVDFTAFVPGDISETSDKIGDVMGKMLALQEKKEQYESEIEELKADQVLAGGIKKSLESELERVQKQYGEIQEELRDYPEYESRYQVVKEGTNDAERMMRAVGNALDWITVFIPGKAYVTAGTKMLGAAGKVASKIPKAGKVVTTLSQAANVLNKSEDALKIAHVIDGVHDTGKAFISIAGSGKDDGTTSSQFAKENRSSFFNLLDFFSFQHHFGNIGKKFDKKPLIELDMEYENKYNKGKQDILNRMSAKAEEEIKKKEAVYAAVEKAKRAELEEKIRINKRKAAEDELAKLEKELKREQNRKLAELMKAHYLKEAENSINIMVKELLEKLSIKMDSCIQDYIISCNFGVTDKMKSMKNEMDELEKMYHSASKEEMEETIEYYNAGLQFCQSLMVS